MCRRSRQDSFTLFAPGATPRLKIRGWELRALRGGFSIVNSYINGLSLPAPGRGCLDIPLRFFRAGGKNSGAQRHQIWHACSEILCAHCVQVSAPGHVRSGHKVMLSDSPKKIAKSHIGHSFYPINLRLTEVNAGMNR